MVRQTHVSLNVTKSTKLQGAQCSPELAFRSTDFQVAENLIFPTQILDACDHLCLGMSIYGCNLKNSDLFT